MKKILMSCLAFLMLSTFSNAQTVFTESFDATTTPAGWTNTAVTGDFWKFSTGAGYDVATTLDHSGNGGNYAWVDFSATDDSTILTSPTIDVSTLSTPYLEFYFESHYTGVLTPFNFFHVEAWNGTAWVNVTTLQGNTPFGWDQYGYNMTAFTFGGGDSLKVRFHAESGLSIDDYYNDLLLDDIAVMEQPTCPNPNNLSTANVTGISADFAWAEPGTATSWEVQFGPQGFTAGAGTGAVVTALTYSATGLTGDTDYAFYVRSICGAGDTSTWAGPFAFTTLCPAAFTPTYTEDFGTYLSPCWSEAEGVLATGTVLTGTSSLWAADGFANVGTTGAAKINLYSTGRNEWIVSPSIDLGTGATSYQLEFDLALTDFANTNVGPLGVDDTIAVVISTDNGATWDVTNILQAWVQGSEPSNTGDHITLSLVGYTGLVKFGFYAASSVTNEDNDVFVDNFLVTNLASCPATSLLTTSNVTANTVDLAWTENGSATAWIVEYGAAGFSPGTGTMVSAGANPFTLPGLMPTTSYDIYVRAFCAVGDTSTYGSSRNIFTLATCPAPSALAVLSATPTTANLAWTESGSATNWQVEFGVTGFAPGAGNNNFTTSNPFTATTLTANTAYEFYVRSVCGSADSSLWVGPFAFATPCNAVTAPYLEAFATNALPTCWIQGGATTWEYGSVTGTTPTGFADYGANTTPDHSVGGAGTFIGMDGSDNTNGEVSTLMSPLVDIAPLAAPELSYWVFSNNVDDATLNKLIVEFYDGANWMVIDSIQANLGATWVEFRTDLSAFTVTGNTQVRFTVTGDNTGGGFEFYNDILIDDVSFREALVCLVPSALTTTNITATSADLGWTENGAATSWQVEYGAQGFAQGAGMRMIAGTNPFNITGLTATTSYGFYVRSVCAPGDTSGWAGPFTFGTPCAIATPVYLEDFTTYLNPCWYEAQGVLSTSTVLTGTTSDWTDDAFGNTGSNDAARINLFGTGRDEWVISQSIDLGTVATNYQLEFDIALTDYNSTAVTTLGVDDTIAVVISTDNGATWEIANTLQAWLPGSEPSNTGDHIVIDLSAYTGIVRFGFYAASSISNEDNDVFVDNFLVTNLATCPAPNPLTVANITATTADLGWTETGTATSWEVQYGAAGFATGTGSMMVTGTNPFTATLMPATDYEFYVRAICGPADSSSWSGPFAFTTPCPAVFTPAYFTDFSTFTPNCWDEAGDGTPATGGPTSLGTGSWFQDGASASINLFFNNRSEWLLSPAFDLSAGGWELVINANATDYNNLTQFSGMGSDDTLQVVVSTDGGATWAPIYTWDVNNTPALTGTDLVLDLSAYTGASNLFGIWASEGTVNDLEDYDLFVNSFEIRAIPPPANLVITEIMYNPPEGGTDTLEFVEIYNNDVNPVDLTNYTLSGITYTFPAVTLPVGAYYVVAINASAFNNVFGFAADGIATGGLSNGGEVLMIRTPAGIVVDSVDYDDSTPWPSGAAAGQVDGGGASLVLCDAASDNADGANWNACVTSTGVTINGNVVLASPGAANFCPAPLDVAVSAYYNLDSIYCNAGTITGSVIITNMSTTDAMNVPYTITANGAPLGGGTITLLAGNASDTITVGPFPAATGIANVVTMTSLTGDIDANNDMLSMLVYVSNTATTASVATMIACNGDSTGSVMAVGTDGIGSYSYEWNADANLTMATLTNVPAGMYTVVAMDSVGCTDTAMVTLTEPTVIVLTDSVDNVLCNGDSTGMAMVMATGGTPTYSFAWSNGATSDANMNVAAGSYTVTVTDGNGCMEMLTSTVAEPTALDVVITDNGDGTAYATATGGTAGYTFLWDAAAANQTTDTATALINNGTYMVTATDANGCTDTASVVITIVSVNNIANLSNLNLFPNPTNANVFVSLELVENADVQINITNSIGQLVISKELTNVQSETVELNTSTLASGVYMVQFTIGSELVTRKLIVSKQ